jgi:transposase
MTSAPLAIGVGFDTARYGHHVTFLLPDLEPACPGREIIESQMGYQFVRQQLQDLQQRHGDVHFHIRLDAAGQYAANLEAFLRALPFPKTITVGEPARNDHYRKAISPKRKADPVESYCAARFALVERPRETPATPEPFRALREIVQRLEGQTRQSTRLTNQLHNLLARVFPELATFVTDLQTGWVLRLLDKYPTPAQLARCRLTTLTALPHVTEEKAEAIHQAAAVSVASFTGETAAALVRQLVTQLRQSSATISELKKLMAGAYGQLPPNRLDSIPGIGTATAAVLTAKMVTIDRFGRPESLVSYFGVFPEEDSSGVDRDGRPKIRRQQRMSPKGNDLVRKYLWNAALTAIVHNPAVKALYARLRSRGVRGDVAVGHCMRKLLHLVFAVWKSGRPFDPEHYPWQTPAAKAASRNEETAGHKAGASPARKVVTAVPPSVSSGAPTNKSASAASHEPDPSDHTGGIDFAALRHQITLEQVLAHLGCLTKLKGSGPQRRGACPIHDSPDPRGRTFSAHLGKNVFQCFHPPCGAHGNVLDLWAAFHRLPLYEAARHLAQTFGLSLSTPGPEKRNT